MGIIDEVIPVDDPIPVVEKVVEKIIDEPIITLEPEPTPVPTPTPSYTCDCSKTCGEMASCEEAYYQLNTCGC